MIENVWRCSFPSIPRCIPNLDDWGRTTTCYYLENHECCVKVLFYFDWFLHRSRNMMDLCVVVILIWNKTCHWRLPTDLLFVDSMQSWSYFPTHHCIVCTQIAILNMLFVRTERRQSGHQWQNTTQFPCIPCKLNVCTILLYKHVKIIHTLLLKIIKIKYVF